MKTIAPQTMAKIIQPFAAPCRMRIPQGGSGSTDDGSDVRIGQDLFEIVDLFSLLFPRRQHAPWRSGSVDDQLMPSSLDQGTGQFHAVGVIAQKCEAHANSKAQNKAPGGGTPKPGAY